MKYDRSTVSIVICCKNEGEGIAKILESAKPYADEIIVVDGHSNDGTMEAAEKFGAKFYLDNCQGRGEALKTGLAKTTKPMIVFYDADGSHNPNDIPDLVAPLAKNEADMVIGSRTMGGTLDMSLKSLGDLARIGGSYFMVYLVNKRFKTNLTDLLYSFRAIRREVAKKLDLEANNFAIEQDMVVRCLKKGYKIVEVPSQERARGWGVAKLKTSMGIELLCVLIRDLYFKS